ncbi:hypothetical protein MJ258_11110, partial [Legionella sp. EUR-108]|uniref:hypothetical protein n=1 Tax=Legionella maioricensis TaxID=2896528 RepID=UPI0020279CF8
KRQHYLKSKEKLIQRYFLNYLWVMIWPRLVRGIQKWETRLAPADKPQDLGNRITPDYRLTRHPWTDGYENRKFMPAQNIKLIYNLTN